MTKNKVNLLCQHRVAFQEHQNYGDKIEYSFDVLHAHTKDVFQNIINENIIENFTKEDKMITSTLITSFLLTTPMINDKSKDNSIIENKIQLSFKEIIPKQKDSYNDIFKELNSYKDLKPNWDGYDGREPSDDIVNTTKNF